MDHFDLRAQLLFLLNYEYEILKVHIQDDYAFVHFVNHQEAEMALNILTGSFFFKFFTIVFKFSFFFVFCLILNFSINFIINFVYLHI